MTSGQDVSEYLDTLGLVKSYFFKFLRKKIKKNREFFLWCSDTPEDQAISLFAGLLANPDMSLNLPRFFNSRRVSPLLNQSLVLGCFQ
jgi:hypothetical protein